MGKKIMTDIVATNVIASQLPEQQPSATPIARAEDFFKNLNPRENCSVFKKILPKLEIHLIHDETAMFDMPGGGGGNGGI